MSAPQSEFVKTEGIENGGHPKISFATKTFLPTKKIFTKENVLLNP